uniref:Uncharacterized protein n=1 Tax=Anguilla anguilla TaxID=7936 RepID=A0A0E9SIR0_ANGAN
MCKCFFEKMLIHKNTCLGTLSALFLNVICSVSVLFGAQHL